MRLGLARAAQAGAAVYLTAGELETESIRGGVPKFVDALRAAPAGQAPASTFSILPDEDHNSTPHRSLYNALESRYRSYRLPLFLTWQNSTRSAASTECSATIGCSASASGIPPCRRRIASSRPPNPHRRRAFRRGDKARRDVPRRDYPRIAEQIVNAAGYVQLRRGRRAEGLTDPPRNARMFPDSPNVHDSLGDARCLNGDEKGALESRQNAVRTAERASRPRLSSVQAKLTIPCAQRDLLR